MLEKYNMPCHAMHPMQDYFWKVFHMYGKLMCNLYALLCWQNFILVKMGVTDSTMCVLFGSFSSTDSRTIALPLSFRTGSLTRRPLT
jgi:hypothetical protein